MKLGNIILKKVFHYGRMNEANLPPYFLGLCNKENSQYCGLAFENENKGVCENCPYLNKKLYNRIIKLYKNYAFAATSIINDEVVLNQFYKVLEICNKILERR